MSNGSGGAGEGGGGEDNEWQRWVAAFRGAAPPVPDEGALRARVRREARRLWANVAGEVVSAVAVVAFFGWYIVRMPTSAPVRGPVVAIASVIFAGTAVWVGWMVRVRAGTFGASATAVVECLEVTLARRRADVKWYRFARAWGAAFGVVVAAWAPFMLAAGRVVYAREPWRAVVGFGGAAAILAGCLWWYTRKLAQARREVAELEAVRDAVRGTDIATL